MEHKEHLKKIKELVGDFLGEIAEEKRVTGSNIAVVKEAVSAYEKLCDLCEDDDSGEYGARRPRNSRGQYMDGSRIMGGYNPNYGWMMPGPYYAGGYGMDKTALADELEGMASSGMGDPEMVKSLREAARHLRKG